MISGGRKCGSGACGFGASFEMPASFLKKFVMPLALAGSLDREMAASGITTVLSNRVCDRGIIFSTTLGDWVWGGRLLKQIEQIAVHQETHVGVKTAFLQCLRNRSNERILLTSKVLCRGYIAQDAVANHDQEIHYRV